MTATLQKKVHCQCPLSLKRLRSGNCPTDGFPGSPGWRLIHRNLFWIGVGPWLVWLSGLVCSHPANQKIVGSIPSQGMYLGCRFGFQSEHMQEATSQCFSLSLMFLSLSPSFLLSLESIKERQFLIGVERACRGSSHALSLIINYPTQKGSYFSSPTGRCISTLLFQQE